MKFTKEQIENELRGYYRTGCFHIYLKGSFDGDLENLSFEDLSTFTHEYVHYLQNISTPYGIFEANTRHQAAIEVFRDIESKDTITLPFEPTYSANMQDRLMWVYAMNGDPVPENGCADEIEEKCQMSYGFDYYYGENRTGRKVWVKYKTKTGTVRKRYIGALDIKEGMAVAYQKLLGDTTPHPDIPYNILSILCKQHFPSVYSDPKKFICICYTSLFDLSPASFFISICLDERINSTKSGFQIFDEFVVKSPIRTPNGRVGVQTFFNGMLETFKKSIKGFLRVETPYIDKILDSVRLENGIVPLLNIINTDQPITVRNIKALVRVVGIPYIHSKDKGWYFPALDGQGAGDVVHMVGLTWMNDFLLQREKSRIGICPFVSMCGQLGDYCYDQPWKEPYEKCCFNLIADDTKISGKTFKFA